MSKQQRPLPTDATTYTLSSYDPVSVEITLPRTTDEEVELALDQMLAEAGGSRKSLDDATWMAKAFDGIETADELRAAVRDQLREMNERIANDQKRGRCLAALSARLEQRVPAEVTSQIRDRLVSGFNQRLQATGQTLMEFLRKSGSTRSEFEAMFDDQARIAAEQDAALDAFAASRGLEVSEHEFARLLHMKGAEARDLVEKARQIGQYGQLRAAALRNKAAEVVVSESVCTYRDETPGETATRLARLRENVGAR